MDYEDILYDEKNGVATITINRPKVYNAFRPRTCVELIDAFLKAGWSEEIGAIVLTGAGNKAFCTG
ncbi:MAG: enoyl-CoA hydratase-related protein, partial [Alphaproteobacteria bacterium]|nr:enoyl-CoA hydratase-related protein [Alphaproteobacteria bacterium]MDX5492092.1 enoyl-CoA hydratase-related protein [Alphaproteobacteria bacterium]